MDYCISFISRRSNDFRKADRQGKNPFAKGATSHGEQCRCAGIKLTEGKGNRDALSAPRPVDLDPLSENSHMSAE